MIVPRVLMRVFDRENSVSSDTSARRAVLRLVVGVRTEKRHDVIKVIGSMPSSNCRFI